MNKRKGADINQSTKTKGYTVSMILALDIILCVYSDWLNARVCFLNRPPMCD
jgi:hypothetical protein